MASAAEVAQSMGLGSHQRHIFLCADPSKPKCCPREVSLDAWEYLKQRLKELNLVGPGGVLRTKANCLQLCADGPIMVVYPEGIWYKTATREAIEKILQEHILGGRPVAELSLGGFPLACERPGEVCETQGIDAVQGRR